jgi:hypothetical protein
VDPLWQAFIWSAIPVALLLLATAVSVYALRPGSRAGTRTTWNAPTLMPGLTRPAPPRSPRAVRPDICPHPADEQLVPQSIPAPPITA